MAGNVAPSCVSLRIGYNAIHVRVDALGTYAMSWPENPGTICIAEPVANCVYRDTYRWYQKVSYGLENA